MIKDEDMKKFLDNGYIVSKIVAKVVLLLKEKNRVFTVVEDIIADDYSYNLFNDGFNNFVDFVDDSDILEYKIIPVDNLYKLSIYNEQYKISDNYVYYDGVVAGCGSFYKNVDEFLLEIKKYEDNIIEAKESKNKGES